MKKKEEDYLFDSYENDFDVKIESDDDLDDFAIIERYYKRKKIIKISLITFFITIVILFIAFSIVAYNTEESGNNLVEQNDFENIDPDDYFG